MIEITTDHDIINKALAEAEKRQFLEVTAEGVRAVTKPEQNTIILRDIASSIPASEIAGLFEAEGCPRSLSVRSDINDTW